MTTLSDLVVEAAFGRTSWKMPVRTLATANVTRQGLQTISGVVLQAGDRVLLTSQTTPKDNGPWVVFNGTWERPLDFNVPYKASLGAVFLVLAGTHAGELWRMSSPTSGDVVLGATALSFVLLSSGGAGGAGAIVQRPYSSDLDLAGDTNYYEIFGGEGSPLVKAFPAGNFAPGRTVITVVPAGSAGSATVPSDSGDGLESETLPPHWDLWDSAKDYVMTWVAVSTTQVQSSGKNLGLRDSHAPLITSSNINLTTDNTLITANFDRRMRLPTNDDVSVIVNAVNNPISIVNGEGQQTLQIVTTNPVPPAAVVEIEIASGRTWRSLNGVLAAPGTYPVTLLGGFTTADLANRTLQLRGDLGNAAADGAVVSPWISQAAGAFNYIEATNRPVRNNDGINTVLTTVDFDGTDDILACATATVDALTGGGSDYYAAGIAMVPSSVGVGTAANYNTSNGIICDPTGWWGVFYYNDTGVLKLVAYQYDTTNNARIVFGGTLAFGTPFSWAVRHDATNGLRLYGNGTLIGTAATSTAGVNSGGLSVSTHIGKNGGSLFSQIRHHEIVVCSANPSDTDFSSHMSYYTDLLA